MSKFYLFLKGKGDRGRYVYDEKFVSLKALTIEDARVEAASFFDHEHDVSFYKYYEHSFFDGFILEKKENITNILNGAILNTDSKILEQKQARQDKIEMAEYERIKRKFGL